MNVKANRIAIALLVWSVFGGFRAYAQPKYSVTELAGINTFATGINNSGQVTGAFPSGPVQNTVIKGFRTAPNSPVNLPGDDISSSLSGILQTQPNEISNAGQVVGFGRFSPVAPYMGFRTAPNSPIQSGDLLGALGGTSSFGNGVNQSGRAAGAALLVGDSVQHAFRTAPNAAINPATDDLGTLPVDPIHEFSEAKSINSIGQVAGSSNCFVGGALVRHAFRSTPNGQPVVLTDLGTLGGLFSEAFGINDSGVVVGQSDAPGGSRAFRTAPNSMINPATDNLGVLDNTDPQAFSEAFGVNNAGQVVVGSSSVGSEQRAFLHTGGVMYDLNKLIPAGSGWKLTFALAINEAGQIVGFGIRNGAGHAFRLDPGQPYSAVIQQPINAMGRACSARRKA